MTHPLFYLLHGVLLACQVGLVFHAWRLARSAKDLPETLQSRVGQVFMDACEKVHFNREIVGEGSVATCRFDVTLPKRRKLFVMISSKEIAA